jgi:hypothetical protein
MYIGNTQRAPITSFTFTFTCHSVRAGKNRGFLVYENTVLKEIV